LEKFVFPKINHGDFFQVYDFKSQLQEFIQRDNLGNIEYQIVEEIGPAHDREFHTEVKIEGRVYGNGIGKSKKVSEQNAAHQALKKLGVLEE